MLKINNQWKPAPPQKSRIPDIFCSGFEEDERRRDSPHRAQIFLKALLPDSHSQRVKVRHSVEGTSLWSGALLKGSCCKKRYRNG